MLCSKLTFIFRVELMYFLLTLKQQIVIELHLFRKHSFKYFKGVDVIKI